MNSLTRSGNTVFRSSHVLLVAALALTWAFAIASADPAQALATCDNNIVVPNPSSNPALVADCITLLDLMDALRGTATLDWSESKLITSWEGITLSLSPQQVTGIDLSSKGLDGSIPSDVGDLSKLTQLLLQDNQLTGSIPVDLGDLSNLLSLKLSNNQLTGSIPSELADLTSLSVLELSFNQLTGSIPSELGGLSGLAGLNLSFNQLSGTIPSELGGLSGLAGLNLSFNQLTGTIPSELGGLSGLAHLQLHDNQLSGPIPSELGNLSNLSQLRLSNNQLDWEIPDELDLLADLRSVWLNGNFDLTGTARLNFTALTSARLGYMEKQTWAVADFSSATSWSLLGTDSDDFQISTDGVLTFVDPPVFQSNSYYVQVTAFVGGTQKTADITVFVLDRDIALTVSPSSMGQEDSATNFTVTATMDEAPTVNTTVTLSLSGTATGSGDDYTAGALSNITILANSTSSTTTLTLTPTDDAIVEGEEVVKVAGASGVLAVSSAWITVEDNDTATLTLSGPSEAVVEGSDATFTVTLSRSIASDVTVAWAVTPNSGDFSPSSGSVTLPANSAPNAAQTFSVTAQDDDLSEGDESFSVSLGTITSAISDRISVGSSVSVTIAESDPLAVPDAPMGLTATPGDGQVALGWDDPENSSISDYELSIDGLAFASIGGNATTTSHTVDQLTNGTSYSFAVRAVNASGTGESSDTVSATPLFAAPEGLMATVGYAEVMLSWDNPGNSSISGYELSIDGGAFEDIGGNADTVQYTKTGLTGGTGYTFALRAVYGVAATVSATPLLGAPTGLTAIPGDAEVSLIWDDPGNSSISGYELSIDGLAFASIGGNATTTSHTVDQLNNGTSYSFAVRAVNASGTSESSDTVSATPLFAAPEGLMATVGYAAVMLSWDNPGNSSISGYELSIDGGAFEDIGGNADTAQYTKTGLNGGTEYTFALRAVYGVAAMVSATPLLGAPTGLTAMPGDAEVSLIWDDPGNSSISGYELSIDGLAFASIGGNATTTSHTVDQLTNGTSYSFAVRAVNASGTGESSDTVSATPLFAAPEGLMATVGYAEVMLIWDNPGNSSISGYELSIDGGAFEDIGGNADTVQYTKTGLTGGTEYTFALRAVYGVAATVSATPLLGAPTGLTAIPGDSEVSLIWDDPGNSSISGYELSIEGLAFTSIGGNATTTSHTVDQLTNGTSYSFAVRGLNASGTGAEASVSATPLFAAPNSLVAAVGDGEVTLTWADPGNSSISGYEVSKDGGTNYTSITGSGATTTSHTIDQLTNGTSYTFAVRALNGAAATVSATPLAVPDAPMGLTATPGDGQVALGWDDPENSSISGYELSIDGLAFASIGGNATTTSHTVDQLNNGTSYSFAVLAVNASGTGESSDTVSATPRANMPPVANDDNVTTLEDTAVVIRVLENDTDADDDTLSVTAVSTPSNGGGAVTDDGTTVIYTPQADFHGSDSFDYEVSDGNEGTDTGTVNVTVIEDVGPPTPTRTPEPTPTPTPVPTPTRTPVPTPTRAPVPATMPTTEPTVTSTPVPTVIPTTEPTVIPTTEPTAIPTTEPTAIPTTEPTVAPTSVPTVTPTPEPTVTPTPEPTASLRLHPHRSLRLHPRRRLRLHPRRRLRLHPRRCLRLHPRRCLPPLPRRRIRLHPRRCLPPLLHPHQCLPPLLHPHRCLPPLLHPHQCLPPLLHPHRCLPPLLHPHQCLPPLLHPHRCLPPLLHPHQCLPPLLHPHRCLPPLLHPHRCLRWSQRRPRRLAETEDSLGGSSW